MEENKEKFLESRIEDMLADNIYAQVLYQRIITGQDLTTQEKYVIAKELTFGTRWGSETSLKDMMGL